MLRYVCLVALVLLSNTSLLASAADDEVDSLSQNVALEESREVDNLEDIKLPPLSLFMESIQSHPTALIYETYKKEEEALLKEEKRKWMDYLRVVANYQFGYNSMYTESTNVMISTVNNKAQHSYNAGLSLSIPIGNLVSNKQRVLAQEQVLRRVEYEQQIAIEQRRLLILDAYNRVSELWSVLKAKSESVALYDAQMKISEHDYINGEMTIEELSLERARRSSAVVTYQEARTSLQSAIVLLEMLTNVKVIE